MPRTSPIYYIAPSAIGLTPNCNESEDDIDVYLARGARIKVYAPAAGIGVSGTSYAEWLLKGRNRRLADSTKPYTIYARLPKADHTKGYLVFAPKNGSSATGWTDKYAYLTPSGLGGPAGAVADPDNWYVLLGSVSLPEDHLRTIELDTGILGTDQYNSEWTTNPDVLQPITVTCTIDGVPAGPTPYVYWGKTLVLSAALGGWADTDIERFDHWEIVRSTGDDESDAGWLEKQKVEDFAGTGTIDLVHSRDNADDFGGAVAPTFKVTAWGVTRYGTSKAIATASVSVLAETLESYAMDLSAAIVSYNPMTKGYTPADGVTVRVRATDQKGDMFRLTRGQFLAAGLSVGYSVAGSGTWTPLPLESGGSSDEARVVVPVTVFHAQKSVEVSLVNYYNKELAVASVAFVRDGEDGREREWIFLRSAEPIEFGDASSAHPRPALITMGEVSPSGTARSITPYDDTLADWVPAGWTDDATGTTEEIPYEYASHRDYVHEDGSDPAHWGAFTTPAMWSHFGQDGVGIDSITRTYAISAYGTTADDSTPPSDVTAWSAGSPAVTEARPFLWVKEITVFTDAAKNTTRYYCIGRRGDNGIDAQDVEWAYIRTKSILPPTIADDTSYTDCHGNTYTADDHLPRVVAESGSTDIEGGNSGDPSKPYECTDDPKGTSDTWPFEWEIKRTKGAATNGHRTWNPYSGTMILRTDPAFHTYISTIIGSGSGNANTVALAQRAVLGALDGVTVTDGGLMLTSMIVMRKLKPGGNPSQLSSYDTWAGISGMYDASALGTGIAAWYGGSMTDYEGLTDEEKTDGWDGPVYHQRWARSLFRFDGSGYVASGNISWDHLGNVVIRGSVVQDASFVIDGSNVTSQLRALLAMFTLEGDGTASSPYVIKANYSLYTEQSLSALGRGSGGSGGGGAQELNDLLDVIISNPRQNQVIKFDGTHFINADAPSGGIDMAAVWAALAAGTNEQINASHLINIQPGADMASVWAALAAATNEQIDAAHLVNALAAYATQTWVGQQGYITSSGSCAYATSAGSAGSAGSANIANYVYCSSHIGSWKLSIDWDNTYFWLTGEYQGGHLPCAVAYATSAGSAGSAGYIEGTNAAASPEGALLRSGANRNDDSPSGDTWIYYDTLGGPYSYWGIRHTQGPNRIDFCGHGAVTSYIDLNTGGIVCNGLTSNYDITAGNNITASGSISASGNVSAGNGITGTYVYASSYVSTASDARKKNVLGNIELTVEQIAAMPAVRFTWKDKSKPGVFVGTLAQSWRGPLPEAVHEQEDGTLSFDYSNAALVSVTVVSRRVMDQERVIREQDRVIRQQGREIRDLRCEVNDLKREMAELKAMLNLALGKNGEQ